MKISEAILLKKLGLSKKFPRRILYAKKSELGVGILKPSTIISILALKLYIGHKRKEDKISRIIEINKKNTNYQYEYNEDIIKTPRNKKSKNLIWSDEIAQILENRKIAFENVTTSQYIKTANKSIMDLAHEYISNQELDKRILPV